jgi:sigma-B regulation protein RsbU (phosphoserine phosphatase)
MLIISLVPLFVTGFVSYYSMTSMRDSITAISDQMGSLTAGSSGNAIRSHIRSNYITAAKLTAKLVDERLSHNGGDITGVSDIIKDTLGTNADIFLLADDGSLLIDSKGNFLDGKENYNDSDDPGKRFIARAIANDDSYSIDISVDGEKVYFSYSECEQIPASVVVIVPVAIADMDVNAISDSVIALNHEVTEEVKSTRSLALTILGGTVVFAALAAMIMALRFARNITVPIEKLTEEVSKINGDETLSMQIDIRTGDEVEALADSFNLMTERLHGFIIQLEKSTAEKERAKAELSVVKNLRDMAFPHIIPGYLDRYEIDIYGTTKENSGHVTAFYNYFPVTDDKIAVICAEVSGNDITAAVKMLIAKTLIEQDSHSSKSLEEVFYNLNNILYEKEKTELTVSAFMGYISLSDGKFDYITAGINAPFIRRAYESYKLLECKDNISLAVRENNRFYSGQTTLSRGDRIFIYSNSTINAKADTGETYGQELLLRSVNECKNFDIQEICDMVYKDIRSFSAEPLTEDIMMVAAEFIGKSKK